MSEEFRFFNPDNPPFHFNHGMNQNRHHIRGVGSHKLLMEFRDESYNTLGQLQAYGAISMTAPVLEKAFLECKEVIYKSIRAASIHGGSSVRLSVFVSKNFLCTSSDYIAFVAYPEDKPLEEIREEDTTLYINKTKYNEFPIFSRAINKLMTKFKGKVCFEEDPQKLNKMMELEIKLPPANTMAKMKEHKETLMKALIEEMKTQFA